MKKRKILSTLTFKSLKIYDWYKAFKHIRDLFKQKRWSIPELKFLLVLIRPTEESF